MSPTRVSEPAAQTPEHHEILRDLVVGGLSVGAAALGAISHFGQGGRLHDDYGAEPGPALLPELLLAALAAVGVLLVLRGLLARSASAARQMAVSPIAAIDGEVVAPQTAPTRALAALGATLVFAVLQAAIGFGAAACILGAVLSAALGLSEGRSMPRSAAEGLAVAGILFSIFRYLLSVPLT